MPLHSFSYSYSERKVYVTASHCNVKIRVYDSLVNEPPYESSHDIGEKNTIWTLLNRRWHSDYTIKILIDGEIEHVEHTSLNGKTVRVTIDSKALGDTLAWFPQVLEFQKTNGCHVKISTYHNYLLGKYESPYINLINPDDVVTTDATYVIGAYENPNLDPHNFRTKSLQKCASDILDIPYRERHVDLRHLVGKRPIKEPYVVITTSSTMSCKEWHNSNGWQEVVDYLKGKGYKVVQIPRKRIGMGIGPVISLSGVEDVDVSDNIIDGAIKWIGHCEFYIGLASGLSWLARSLDKKVVMISGFSDPFVEFKSKNFRVANKSMCHGCYNDTSIKYGREWEWCPKNKDFECTKSIESSLVVKSIDSVISKIKHRRKKILIVIPHASTGGSPEYTLQVIKILREVCDVDVAEWSFSGASLNVQRLQIMEMCRNFYELGNRHRNSFQKIIDEGRYDCVHFEEMPSMLPNNGILAEFHDLHRQTIIHTSHSCFRQEVWGNVDRFVFPSAYQKEVVYHELKNVEILEFPIFDKFCEKEGNELSVLNIGIVSPHKNQRYLCDIMRRLPEIKCYMAGPLADNFAGTWKMLQASSSQNVIWLGQQDSSQLEELYKRCSIMIHPSLTELCPLVFNECQSFGLPLLVNYLQPYDYLPYNANLGRLSMNLDADVEMIKKSIEIPRKRIEPTYEIFKNKILNVYEC